MLIEILELITWVFIGSIVMFGKKVGKMEYGLTWLALATHIIANIFVS